MLSQCLLHHFSRVNMSGLKVWSRFSAKSRDGTVLKLRIEDMPEDRIEDVTKLLMTHYAPEESLHKGSGVPKNPEAMAELLKLYKESWNEKPHQITICVSDDETDTNSELLGASLMVLETKEEAFKEITYDDANTEEIKKFLEIMKCLSAKYNVFEKYDLDEFYDGRGVVVLPKCRGLGIAQEFFRVRRLMCKEHNIPMTGAWMTSFGTQKAAIRDNWETVCEMNTEDFEKEVGVKFEKVPPTCIFMIARGE
ncbi:uncharacterized protein LOC115443599 [Manduca sexta]|uniref:N-acetyltransferase domain-containing protein n=1 Tax=Manduca sexta TaxID=7130 RepID=A0A921Z3P7_MANSE|nr:uncharacterized protein LOC115443599 [Manduca sexta]KAG6450270.1 hypothetical protein O3G_MSEX006479 [Manduca sexta]